MNIDPTYFRKGVALSRLMRMAIWCCTMAITNQCVAQQKDFRGMVGFSASHNLNKSWEINGSLQALFYQNLIELWIANADLGIVYNLNNHWKTEFHLRAIKFRSLENDYENRSLYFHTLTFSDSWRNFGFSIRHRTQQLVYGDHWNDAFKGPVWYLRDRMTIRYKVNYYWSPFVACETFVPLNHSRREGIDQWRFSLGVVRTFSDRFRMDFRYQIQQPTQRLTRSTNFLANINCYFKF